MEQVNSQPNIILPTQIQVINQIWKDIGENLIAREDSFIIKYQSNTSPSLHTTIYRKINNQYIAIEHNIKDIENLKKSKEKLEQLRNNVEVNLLSVRQELLKLSRLTCESYVVRPVNPCTTVTNDVNYIIVDENLFLSVDEENILEGCEDCYEYYCEDNEWKRNLPLANSITKENVHYKISETLTIITDKITQREEQELPEQEQQSPQPQQLQQQPPQNTEQNEANYMKMCAQMLIGLVPVVGPATNAIWNFSTGDVAVGFVDVGFCVLDAATLGGASATKGILFGSKIIGKVPATIIRRTTTRAVAILVTETYFAQRNTSNN